MTFELKLVLAFKLGWLLVWLPVLLPELLWDLFLLFDLDEVDVLEDMVAR
jgi:hypothetical protein